MSLEMSKNIERSPVLVDIGAKADAASTNGKKRGAGTTLGVDIGGTCVKGAMYVDGACVGVTRSPSYTRPIADDLRSAIRSLFLDPIHDLRGVGLCVPGVMDAAKRLVTLAVNVPGLVGLQLDQMVPRALGMDGERPTRISNDAAAAAHDIYRSRKVSGRMLVLTLGTGVGAAVLDDGVLLEVEGESPGHIGQLDVSVPGASVVGPDGGAGGLEGYIGVPAICRRYGVAPSEAVSCLHADDPAILALVHALRICHAIYRPQHIFLCGGIGIRLGHLLPAIRHRIEHQLTSLARPGWTLQCGEDDFHAARGVAQLAAAVVS